MELDNPTNVRCCGPFPEKTGRPFTDAEVAGLEARLGTRFACVGNASCAAWRWKEAKRTEAFVKAVVEHMKASGDTYNKAIQEVVKRRDEFAYVDGFCGLAGGEGTAP